MEHHQGPERFSGGSSYFNSDGTLKNQEESSEEEDAEEEEGSEEEEDSDSDWRPEDEIQAEAKLRDLQRNAYHAVLRAFKAESFSLSARRIRMIRDLMVELKIAIRDHETLWDETDKDKYIEQIRELLRLNQEQISKISPTVLRIKRKARGPGKSNLGPRGDSATAARPFLQNKKSSAGMKQAGAPRSSNLVREVVLANARRSSLQNGKSSAGISSSGGWGRSPESLVQKKVYIRMPGEDNFKEFTIKMYDKQEDLHYLEGENETMEDPLNWIDLRQIPPEDIQWNNQSSEISHQKFSTESVGTILQGTHTILQCGKSSSGMEQAGVSGSSNLEQGAHVADAARPVIEKGKSSSSGNSFDDGWERCPESLVQKKVYIRVPGEDNFKEFTIKMYNKLGGVHYLEGDNETIKDPLNWIDLREIPPEDIQWNDESSEILHRNFSGEPVAMETLHRKFSREPFATILRRTSTYGKKRPDDILFKVPPLPTTANVTAEKPLNKACNEPEKGQGDSTEGKGVLNQVQEDSRK